MQGGVKPAPPTAARLGRWLAALVVVAGGTATSFGVAAQDRARSDSLAPARSGLQWLQSIQQAAVRVNDRLLGAIVGRPEWQRSVLRAPAVLWHREINEIVLEVPPGTGPFCVAAVEFVRPSKRGRRH